MSAPAMTGIEREQRDDIAEQLARIRNAIRDCRRVQAVLDTALCKLHAEEDQLMREQDLIGPLWYDRRPISR